MSDFKIVKLLGNAVVIDFPDSINYTGAYNGATAYITGDAVSYNGSSYVALGATTGNLPTDVAFWQLLAAQGATGATGAAGANGADGADGADGQGVSTGGTTGQVLTKNSNTDFDTGWTNPSPGVTDHGALAGLADDDHTQYHNDARGDARYYTQSQVDTLVGDYVLKSGDTMTGQLIAPSFQVSDSSETLTSSYDSGNNTMLIESSDDLTLKANDTLYVDALVTRTDGEIYHKGSHVLSPDGMSSFNTTFDFGGDFFKLDANKLVVYNAKDFQINGELGIVMQNSFGSSLVLSDLMQIAVNGGGGYSFIESVSGSFLSTKESEPFKIQTPYNDGFFMQAFDGVEFIFGSLINKPFSVYNENPDIKDNQLFLNANGESSLSSYNNNDVKLNAPTGVAINLPSSAATANLDILESDSSKASLRIRAGSAPSSPNDGDIWFDGTNLNIHIGGVTKTFLLV